MKRSIKSTREDDFADADTQNKGFEFYQSSGNDKFNKKDCDEVIKGYQKALELKQNLSIEIAQNLSKVLSKKYSLSEVIYIYINIVERNLNDGNSDCNYYLGIVITQISLRTGQLSKSIEFFKEAIEFQPSNIWLHYYLGLNLANNSKIDQAIEKYIEVIRKSYDFFPAYVQLGILFLKKENLKEAIKYNIQAFRLLHIYSTNRRLIEDLVLSNQELLQKGFIQENKFSVESLEEMRIVLETAINNIDDFSDNTVVELYFTISKILKNQGKLREAIHYNAKASYYKAKKIKPDVYNNVLNLESFRSPNFLIIGVKKCATTSLYDYLVQHPQILPASIKEPQFVTGLIRERKKNKVDLYEKLSKSDLELYLSLFPPHPAEEKYLTGEASTTYMWYPGIEKVVFNSFPKVKLITLLRNPVKRVISEYNFQVELGREKRSLEEMVDSQLEYIRKLNNPSEVTIQPRFDDYLVHSLYFYFIEKWMKIFPRNQFLVLKNEDLSVQPDIVMHKTFEFLDLQKYDFIKYSKKLVGHYPEVDKKILSRLHKFFEPHNKRLEELLNIEFKWD
jgi:tetratricopeptide (TPR) repeat protein